MRDLAFTAVDLERALRGLQLGRPLHFFEAIGSTNDEARRLAEAGAPAGTLVVADEQTAGRGRAGRMWHTPRGAALAASFILRPDLSPSRLGRLTMLGGLAAAEAIEEIAGVPASLKWPNDVLVEGKKVAGVLVESAVVGERIAYAVLGIGVNVTAGPGGAVHYPAASLVEVAGRPVDRSRLLVALAGRLGLRYPEIGGHGLHEAWAARLAWQGEQVLVQTGETEFAGVAEGVNPDGALLVRLESGELTAVAAGDVSLRRSKSTPLPSAPFPTEDPRPLGPGPKRGTGAARASRSGVRPVRFIGEPVEAGFDRPPALEKKPGCPARFTWRGTDFQVVEILGEWHDYRRRGRMARNMQPAHAATAEIRGSWGVGRDFYRVRVAGGQIFDLYYDRAPKGADRRKGAWVLFAEMAETGTST